MSDKQVDRDGVPLRSGEWVNAGVHLCYGWTCDRVRQWQAKNPQLDAHDEMVFCWGCNECEGDA